MDPKAPLTQRPFEGRFESNISLGYAKPRLMKPPDPVPEEPRTPELQLQQVEVVEQPKKKGGGHKKKVAAITVAPEEPVKAPEKPKRFPQTVPTPTQSTKPWKGLLTVALFIGTAVYMLYLEE